MLIHTYFIDFQPNNRNIKIYCNMYKNIKKNWMVYMLFNLSADKLYDF